MIEQLISPELFEIELNIARLYFSQKDFVQAEKSLYQLLLSGCLKPDVFHLLANIYKLTFYFEDAIAMYDIIGKLPGDKFPLAQTMLFYIVGDGLSFLKALCYSIKDAPAYILQVSLHKDLLEDEFGDEFKFENYFFNASKNRLSLDIKNETKLLAFADACMLFEKEAEQQQTLRKIKTPAQTLKYNLSLAGSYILRGRYKKARSILESFIDHSPILKVYQEAVKLAIRMNDYDWGARLFELAKKNNVVKGGVPIDEILLRKFYFATNRIHEAFHSYRMHKRCKALEFFLKDKYFQSPSNCRWENILVLAFFGPGDEIRFASLYPAMRNLFPNKKVTFSCEPKLFPLFKNSYPDLNFIPITRLRKLNYKVDMSNFNRLPSFELHDVFDNQGWDKAKLFTGVTFSTDLLCEVVQDRSSFSGSPFLTPTAKEKAFWENRVQSNRLKIGISWRSSIVSFARNEHYITIQDVKLLLDACSTEEVEFFNFQYDNVDDEFEWLKQNSNHQITNYPDLDQYDDLNSVAALMSCMDLIISPATTVIELAGALGCPTLLLSNSSEIYWRKLNETTKTDIWYHNVTHIEGNTPGDKSSLITNTISAVNLFISEKQSSIGLTQNPKIDSSQESVREPLL